MISTYVIVLMHVFKIQLPLIRNPVNKRYCRFKRKADVLYDSLILKSNVALNVMHHTLG